VDVIQLAVGRACGGRYCCRRFDRLVEIMTSKDQLLLTLQMAKNALMNAEYAINGREHTGFITKAIAGIDEAIAPYTKVEVVSDKSLAQVRNDALELSIVELDRFPDSIEFRLAKGAICALKSSPVAAMPPEGE